MLGDAALGATALLEDLAGALLEATARRVEGSRPNAAELLEALTLLKAAELGRSAELLGLVEDLAGALLEMLGTSTGGARRFRTLPPKKQSLQRKPADRLRYPGCRLWRSSMPLQVRRARRCKA